MVKYLEQVTFTFLKKGDYAQVCARNFYDKL